MLAGFQKKKVNSETKTSTKCIESSPPENSLQIFFSLETTPTFIRELVEGRGTAGEKESILIISEEDRRLSR